jgi:threonine dehydratase
MGKRDADRETLFRMIQEASARSEAIELATPLRRSTFLSTLTGADVFLKLENMQTTGSFKIRGAYNKIRVLLDETGLKGVITASAGNHGQGLAWAAQMLGTHATVVVPDNTPFVKISRICGFGADVVEKGESYDDAVTHAEGLARERGLVYVPAFNDMHVIAGQGTAGLELARSLPDMDALLCPVGGGGLISGIAAAVKHHNPAIRIVGVEASGSPSMKRSLDNGSIQTIETANTIADGIAIKTPGTITFPLVRELVDSLVTVDDTQIANAILKLIEEEHVIVEGAGAVPVAALLNNIVKDMSGRKVVCILSGGNIDVTMLDKIIAKGLVFENRFMSIDCIIPDKPGSLVKLLDLIAEEKANVLDIRHHRRAKQVPFGYTRVVIEMEMRNRAHIEKVRSLLKAEGFSLLHEERAEEMNPD